MGKYGSYLPNVLSPVLNGFVVSRKDTMPERESYNKAMPKPGYQRLENDQLEPIAVVGFAARLPQDATTAESFWQMLCDGRSSRTEIPQDRFNIDAFYHPDPDRVDTVSSNVVSQV